MLRASRILLKAFTALSFILCAGALVLLAAQLLTLRDINADGHQYKVSAHHGRFVVTDIQLVSPPPVGPFGRSVLGFRDMVSIPLWAVASVTCPLPLGWLVDRMKRRGRAHGQGFPVTTEHPKKPE